MKETITARRVRLRTATLLARFITAPARTVAMPARVLARLARVFAVAWLLVGHAYATAQVPVLGLQDAAARLAQGGYLMMIRHARTEPGLGDPPNFRIGDCATQRNLSDEGREQSRVLGALLREAGIRIATVRSSQWCRCRDTAQLAFGDHEPWPALNSFFSDRSDEPARTREVLAYARTLRVPDNAMLVTHQVNIGAVFGVSTSPGEIVAGRWRDGRLVAEFRFVAQR